MVEAEDGTSEDSSVTADSYCWQSEIHLAPPWQVLSAEPLLSAPHSELQIGMCIRRHIKQNKQRTEWGVQLIADPAGFKFGLSIAASVKTYYVLSRNLKRTAKYIKPVRRPECKHILTFNFLVASTKIYQSANPSIRVE